MSTTECENCGGQYHWDWTEAFAKFGFGDGEGQVETWRVESVLTEDGYDAIVEGWGFHNTVITSIKKENIEYIPYQNKDYTFGYDNPRKYFPRKIIILLDKKFPDT